MKQCIKCQVELCDDDLFCSECGAKQPIEEIRNENTMGDSDDYVLMQEEPDQTEVFNKALSPIGGSKWDKIGLIGIVMIGIAVFLPMVNASFASTLTSMINVSRILSFAVLLFVGWSAYYLSEKKFNIPCSVGIGILAVSLYTSYKIHSELSEMEKLAQTFALLFGNATAKAAQKVLAEIGIGMGMYFLLAGSIIVIISCGASRLVRKQQGVELGTIVNEIKNMMMETVELGSVRLPSYIVTIIVVAMIVFAGTTIDVQSPI